MNAAPPKLTVPSRRAQEILPWLGAIACMAAVVAVLFVFDPAANAFYPRCTMKLLTRLDCPGCGGLRATHQLLHGNIAAAFRLNPLFVVLGPFFAIWLARKFLEGLRRRAVPPLVITPRIGWTLVALALAFTVARNLPANARSESQNVPAPSAAESNRD